MVGLIITAIGLGFGLAMDAFSVSLANGLHEPKMKWRRVLLVAGTFAVFQGIMPLIGWVCVHTVLEHFTMLGKFIPWIALALLGFIGGKMLVEGIKCRDGACKIEKLGFGALLLQGVATSIDALSVGFTIAEYGLIEATVACLLIGAVTFCLCFGGIAVGKKAGTHLAGKAGIFGGVILIVIGIEIFIKSFL